MGYRNYIWVIDKKKADSIRNMSLEELKSLADPDSSYVSIFDLREKLNAVEAMELGKYVDNIPKNLQPFFIDKAVQENISLEHEFMIMDIEDLKDMWKNYSMQMTEYYKELSKMTSIEVLQKEFESLASWCSLIDLDEYNKYVLTTSWRYDYACLNLMYLYKIFNPKKQYLVWVGY